MRLSGPAGRRTIHRVPVQLRPPTTADLPYRAAWMADPTTMAYNAGFTPFPGYDPVTGCLAFPATDHRAWLRAWTTSADRFVAFLADDDAAPPLGEVAFRVTSDGDAHLHVLVTAAHAGRGVGTAALRLLLAEAFARPDVARAVDEFPPDREPAARVFARLGFVRDGARVVLTRAAYDDVRVAPGVDPAATDRLLRALPEWFGIDDAIGEYVGACARLPGYLARVAGDVVGVLLVERHAPDRAEIHLLAVAPERHRAGIGRRLVEAAAADLHADGVRTLEVRTLGPSDPSEHYARTRAFHAAHGFVAGEERDDVWPGNPCLLMTRGLAGR